MVLHFLFPHLRPCPPDLNLSLQLLQVPLRLHLCLDLLQVLGLLLSHRLGHVLLVAPVRDLARLPLLLQLLLVPRLHLVQVLEVKLLSVTVVVRDRLLHILQLADARLLVDLSLLPNDLDLLFLLVLDLS
jgi:hypothetical protein